MAQWKKAEESYFADSFNRDSCIAYACADSAISKGINDLSGVVTLNNCTVDGWDSSIATLARGEYCLTADDNATFTFTTKADTSAITTSIDEVIKRVEALEAHIKLPQINCLRHYKRSDFLTLGG